ncbi:zinc knuckle CX2CX4HX4C containing protein [Tanacetum coccineum]
MKLRDEQTVESSKNSMQSLLNMDHLYTRLSITLLKKLNTSSLTQGFSNDEKHETKKAEVSEAVATLDIAPNVKWVSQEEKKMWTDNYAKHLKDLVVNKPRTEEDNKVRMNPRCSALLQYQLPPMEQDPRSFIVPCSIERLDFNYALADLGASISVMPFSMYKCLGIGKLEPISMVIEMEDNTKCTPKGIVKNLLIKMDKFIFPVDFVILDMVEDFRMLIILGRPLLATAHAKVDIFRKLISLEVGNEKVIFKMRNGFTTTIVESVLAIRSETRMEDDGLIRIDYDLFLYDSESCSKENKYGDTFNIDEKKGTLESMNDSERVDLEWEELSFNDWDDMKVNNGQNPEECREDKVNTILEVVLDKLDEAWFNGTSEDEDDLEGILDYLEPKSYDGFIDLDDEAYIERKCVLLGLTYREPPPILIEKVKFTRYTIGPEETYTKVKILGIDEMPRTRDNIATTRDGLMEEMGMDGGPRGET